MGSGPWEEAFQAALCGAHYQTQLTHGLVAAPWLGILLLCWSALGSRQASKPSPPSSLAPPRRFESPGLGQQSHMAPFPQLGSVSEYPSFSHPLHILYHPWGHGTPLCRSLGKFLVLLFIICRSLGTHKHFLQEDQHVFLQTLLPSLAVSHRLSFAQQ